MTNISPKELYYFLNSEGITELYFFTTVKSACTMLRCSELLSMYQITYKGLPSSFIGNEKTYKHGNIWNKIPLYFSDLHSYYNDRNHLGPVCMVISTDFLLDIDEKDLTIAKKRPAKVGKSAKKQDVYYTSIEEFTEDFPNICPGHRLQNTIILVRDKRSHIFLKKHLKALCVDKPETRHMLYLKANKALLAAVKESETGVPLQNRRCTDPKCRCQESYRTIHIDDAEKLFLP